MNRDEMSNESMVIRGIKHARRLYHRSQTLLLLHHAWRHGSEVSACSVKDERNVVTQPQPKVKLVPCPPLGPDTVASWRASAAMGVLVVRGSYLSVTSFEGFGYAATLGPFETEDRQAGEYCVYDSWQFTKHMGFKGLEELLPLCLVF